MRGCGLGLTASIEDLKASILLSLVQAFGACLAAIIGQLGLLPTERNQQTPANGPQELP